jgi:hypothetical protein
MRGAIHCSHAALSEELFDLGLVIECVHSDDVRLNKLHFQTYDCEEALE